MSHYMHFCKYEMHSNLWEINFEELLLLPDCNRLYPSFSPQEDSDWGLENNFLTRKYKQEYNHKYKILKNHLEKGGF